MIGIILLNHSVSLIVALSLAFQVLFFDKLWLKDLPDFSRFMLAIHTGFLFFYVYLIESTFKNTPKRVVLFVLALLVGTGLFYFCLTRPNDVFVPMQISLILAPAILVGQLSESPDDFKIWQWQIALVKSCFEGCLAAALFAAAIFLVGGLIDFVFDVEAKQLLRYGISLGVTILPCLVFLARIAGRRSNNHQFFSYLIHFLILPLWAIYVALLNFYALKILILRELPRGMVSLPVAIGFIAYIAIWWSLKNLDNTPSKTRVYVLSWGKWMHLPLLALMAVAIGRRVYDYGLTQPRYFLILAWLSFATVLGLNLLGRLKGKHLAAICVIAGITSLIPVELIQ